MGQLTDGSPLSWSESKNISEYVRQHGILQFINLYKKLLNRPDDQFKWGDEIEYTIVRFDHENRTAKASLRSHKFLPLLNAKEEADPENVECLWRAEYGSYQLESTPGKPYGGLLKDFNDVERNMRSRRIEAKSIFTAGDSLLSVTAFPRMGCPGFCDPPAEPTPDSGSHQSIFVPDEALFQGHKRWHAITENIRLRRREVFNINMPIFVDVNTPRPFKEDFSVLGDDGRRERLAKADHIFMDSLGFGMGSSCLQVTMQARDLNEAKVLYDHLAAMCPVMVALTAAAPIFRGYLTDCDNRWIATRDSVDDRTPGEQGLEPLQPGERLMRSGRNGSVEWYLSEQGGKFNDLPLEYDESLFKVLIDNGIDTLLAQHVAHLFVRDVICILNSQLEPDDENDTIFFECLQGSTWRSMRFKPPPANAISSIGWRVEFRPIDVQLTDFENAAAVCFVVLLSRIILKYNLNLLIPLSKLDENMERAHKRDAVNKEKFWFRKDIMKCNPNDDESSYCELTVNEIINGKDGTFPGLMPLIKSYVNSTDVDSETSKTVQRILNLFENRANGTLITPAKWMRNQVTEHPDYKKDSVVSERITYDLLNKIYQISEGLQSYPEVTGVDSAQ